MKIQINGNVVTVDGAYKDMPLLWYLRDVAGLTGTKYGCGIGSCGACSVHIDGDVARSCLIPMFQVEGSEVKTIEDLADGDTLSKVQKAWVDLQVPQCGYCQSGMIMAASALLDKNQNPSDEEIDASMSNICRCGTYKRIRKAIRSLADSG